MFHTITAIAPGVDYTQKTLNVEGDIQKFASMYQCHMPIRRGDVTVSFADVAVRATVLEASRYGAARISMEAKGKLGLSGLILGGKSPIVDDRFIKRFMRRNARTEWRLPIPPLEISRRPLFYYAIFGFNDSMSGQDWYDLVENVTKKSNGLGVALLRAASCFV